MKKTIWGTDSSGQTYHLYQLKTDKYEAQVSDLGAVIQSLYVPSSNKAIDVVLGYDTVAEYLDNNQTYFGATIGRNANRIANSRFEIDHHMYSLIPNEAPNNLHSGPNGYHTRKWEVEEYKDDEIRFVLKSGDLDQGYPGELSMEVRYKLTEQGLLLEYTGLSNQTTIFNPTNHSYFNLNGHDSGTIIHHDIRIEADYYTPVEDEHSIPTGELAAVKDTPMDFTQGKEIGDSIDSSFNQLVLTKGYDHNYVLNGPSNAMSEAATVTGEKSGIVMKVYTTLPGIQFYTGNYVANEKGKKGAIYQMREGFCLETQYFPNAINEVNFESPLLAAGQKRKLATLYAFN